MGDDKKNVKSKSEHEKFLHQNTTDEKGAQKKNHYNQYGKQGDDRKKRSAKNEDEDS